MSKENTTQAAANKATEEGGLDELLSRLAFARENEPPGKAKEAKDAIRAYIAADRASRQIANKAEVERQKMHGNGDDGWYFDCDGHYIDVVRDENGKFSIYFRNRSPESEAWLDQADAATLPATTGASTVLTDERIKDICNESGFGEAGFTIRYARAIEREVAAQAAQVAVPEDSLRGTVRAMTLLLNDREWTDLPTNDPDAVALWAAIEELVAENNEACSENKQAELSGWKYVPIKATFGMLWEIMIAHHPEGDEQRLAEDAWDKALAATPSPAKESK